VRKKTVRLRPEKLDSGSPADRADRAAAPSPPEDDDRPARDPVPVPEDSGDLTVPVIRGSRASGSAVA